MKADARANRSVPGRQASSAYLLSWVAMAAFGLGYIGVAATRPDMLGAILPLAEPQQEQVIAGRTAADIADELTKLRKWVHDLQHELAATRSTIQEQATLGAALVQRLTAAEEKLATVKEIRAADPSQGRPVVQRLPGRAQAPAVAPSGDAGQRVAQAVQGQPAQAAAAQGTAAAIDPNSAPANVKVINGAAAIATGSVPDSAASTATQPANAVPSFSQPKVTQPSPTTPRAIEIGSAESLESLRARWGDVASRNPDVLGELAPRYRLATDGRQAPFTLLAGPFENSADATRTCNTLRTKGVPCRVGAYGGNAF